MKKSMNFIVVIVLIIFFSYFIYQMLNFSLFDVELNKITEIKVPNKSYIINLYHIPGDAISQEVIQVIQLLNNTETVLQNYERYNFVNSYEIINDTTLKLILSNSVFTDRKADTVFLKLP